MSSQLLQEYKEYYKVRAEKYANNDNYKNYYEAEKKLCDMILSCSTLEEIKEKMGNLNEECAIALTKDHEIMNKNHFEKHKEDVRVLSSKQILEQIDQCNTALDIAELVGKIENENSVKISMDEAHQEFIDSWEQIDEYRIYKNATVPDKYQNDMQQTCNDIENSLREDVTSIEENNQHFENNWRLIPEKNLEYRHRRLLPFSDKHIEEQLQIYKSIVNR